MRGSPRNVGSLSIIMGYLSDSSAMLLDTHTLLRVNLERNTHPAHIHQIRSNLMCQHCGIHRLTKPLHRVWHRDISNHMIQSQSCRCYC